MGIRRRLTIAATTGIISLGIAIPAFATVEYPAGGVWDYGTENGIVYSDYYHPTSWHKSSVKTSSVFSSPCTAKGYWSKASANDRWWAVDYSYWSFC